MFKTYPTSRQGHLGGWKSTLVCFLIFAGCIQSLSQDRYSTIEEITNEQHKNLFRAEDFGFNISALRKPYILYGNDLQGHANFYLSFDLEDRQNVRYQLVDLAGRQIETREFQDVLNQTYRIEVKNACKGAYIVRLLIDRQYYSEKILFNP